MRKRFSFGHVVGILLVALVAVSSVGVLPASASEVSVLNGGGDHDHDHDGDDDDDESDHDDDDGHEDEDDDSDGHHNGNNKNDPDYWEDAGYGKCVKYENPSTPYTLGAPPAGYRWTLLVVKAGSTSSTNDPHAEYPNPVPGKYYHPSGKKISHVIVCKKPGSGTTTTTSTSTTAPNGCGTYTPRQLTTNKPSAEPGENVTVSGVAGGGDLLTFTISGSGVSTTNLGSTTAAPNGSFSKVVVIPDSFPAGNYTITVKSPKCGRTGTVSITTQSVNRSGCGSGNPLTITRGQPTTWKVITGTPPFNQSKSITLTFVSRTVGGPTYTLYSGAWPANGSRVVTVPNAAPLDRYFLVQTGSQQGNNKARTESCPVRLVGPTAPASSVRAADSSLPPRNLTMVQVATVALVGGAMLLRLRSGRRAGRRIA